MPYIITTIIEDATLPARAPLSRRAVATLEEAHDHVAATVHRGDPTRPYGLIITGAITASGGTVGPLPDGTIIEVEQVNSWDLANTGVGGDSLAEIIDAYNARAVA